MTFLGNFLSLLFDILTIAIFLRVVLSWFSPASTNIMVSILYQVTEPVLAPLRRIIPKVGMFDLTPLVAIILLRVVGTILLRYLFP